MRGEKFVREQRETSAGVEEEGKRYKTAWNASFRYELGGFQRLPVDQKGKGDEGVLADLEQRVYYGAEKEKLITSFGKKRSAKNYERGRRIERHRFRSARRARTLQASPLNHRGDAVEGDKNMVTKIIEGEGRREGKKETVSNPGEPPACFSREERRRDGGDEIVRKRKTEIEGSQQRREEWVCEAVIEGRGEEVRGGGA